MTTLFTFGYANVRTEDALDDLLYAHSIDCVIDVRLKRYSGLRPFSTDIARTFARIPTVGYVWEPKLGNRLYKTDRIEIVDLARLDPVVIKPILEGHVVALMCGCANWATCHRSYLADRVVDDLSDAREQLGFDLGVVHL
jgi:uncharacterized protein (DUF488 family)